MIITPLWHTEFLLDIENKEGKNIRFLVDTWLSDFLVWDLVERSVFIRLDTDKLASIDAIYISHAHTDHLDPYSLLEIYKYANPVLFLPETLRFLESMLRKYILPKNGALDIRFLKNRDMIVFQGIEVMAIAFDNTEITNEDDVMPIIFSNEHEILFAEIDTVPPDTIEAEKLLYKTFTRKSYDTVAYIASRNELEWNIGFLDQKTQKEAENKKREYLHTRKEDIEWWYAKYEYEEYEDFPRIFDIPGFVRGFIGQGLVYPRSLSSALASVSIFPLSEIVDREMSFAQEYGFDFPQKALLPGRQFRLENGTVEPGRKECPIGIIQKEKESIQSHHFNQSERLYATGPLLPREFTQDDLSLVKSQILEILNSRFLPYWSASPVASLRSALIKNKDGCYRIAFKIWSSSENEWIILFEFSFAKSQFTEALYTETLKIDEDYWLADILDFLEGRQEMYSSFWHLLDSKKIYRLWTCLWANFMNHDLLLKKYQFHFERAQAWENSESFFREMIKNIGH